MNLLEDWDSSMCSDSSRGSCSTFDSRRHARRELRTTESVQDLMHSLVNLSVNTNSGSGHHNGEANKLNVLTRQRPKIAVFDRFMPSKSKVDMAHYMFQNGVQNSSSGHSKIYSKALTETVFGVPDVKHLRVLTYGRKQEVTKKKYRDALRELCSGSVRTSKLVAKSAFRMFPKSPERVLDAPDILDDFNLNLLDWSEANYVAIGLLDQIYMWAEHTGEVAQIPTNRLNDFRYISFVGWLEDACHIVCGTDSGKIQVWDVETAKLIRNMETPEKERISAMSFCSHVVTEGNFVGTLRQHDLRVSDHEFMRKTDAHSQEICGIQWSPDRKFCATGGNDSKICIWDSINTISSSCQPLHKFTDHKAAVKALVWSPNCSGILASGGGAMDQTIKLWNASNGKLLKSVDADGAVSSLVWNEGYNEILSSHGHDRNQLTLWKVPKMKKIGDILGHVDRILKMVPSHDRTTVATVGADETIRFWKLFPRGKNSKFLKSEKSSPLLLTGSHGIR